MPIHHDPEQHFSKAYKQEELPHPQHDVNMRRLSEESTGTERCDGPIADIAVDHVAVQAGREGRVSNNGEAVCSDRAELIERIKRGESPTWIPNQAVSRGWSSLRIPHPESLSMMQIYMAIDFASQRVECDLLNHRACFNIER